MHCEKTWLERTLVNVGQNTTLGDGDVAEKLVQLLIVADGELEMTGDDTGLLVVAGSVTGQLEDFGSQVLEDGSEIHGGTGTDTLSVVALAQETVDTTDGEGEAGLGRTAKTALALWSDAQDEAECGRGERRVKSEQDASETGCEKAREGKAMNGDAETRWETYDWALDLEPLALPPDLPPVILVGL